MDYTLSFVVQACKPLQSILSLVIHHRGRDSVMSATAALTTSTHVPLDDFAETTLTSAYRMDKEMAEQLIGWGLVINKDDKHI